MTQQIGLTLGKFAPFHAGHQHVIETALAEMDHVVVVIYDCPETTPIPLPVRAHWIRRLYPMVEVIEAWDGPTEVGDTPEIKRIQEAYILRLLGGRAITHFYSSEFYGEHMSQALHAVNRQIDPSRSQYSVSGTAIRENPYTSRAFLAPVVYRDLITNVLLLGAPSTGKTTLAERLAHKYRTVWMPEYGREFWEQHQVNRRLTADQLVTLAEGHLEREEQLLQAANQYLFTDTSALTTYQFSLAYHGRAAPRLAEIAAQSVSRYDLVFVCDTDIPYDDTWDRSGDVHRHTFQKRVISDLVMRKIPFVVVSGELDTRVQLVESILRRFQKYTNILSALAPLNQPIA